MKIKSLFIVAFLIAINSNIFAQNVAINTDGSAPDASAMLDITATGKGILIPRMALADRPASPVTGLMIYQTDATPGFYYYDGSAWQALAGGGGGGASWELTGNAGTTAGTNFIGTTDNQAVDFRVNDTIKYRLETNGTLTPHNTGYSIFIGENAGLNDNLSNNHNIALGYEALKSNIDAENNIALGAYSLSSVVAGGNNNISLGYYALFGLTSGDENVAIGNFTANFGNPGSYNVMIGTSARVGAYSNSIAIGYDANATASNQVRLGNVNISTFYCQGAYAATTGSGANMFVNSSGQIMRSTSSKRYKKDIVDLEINTDEIYNLRPVSYTGINDNKRYFGLIAEEVAVIIPELVEYAKEKDVIPGSSSEELIPDAVQYTMLSILLLKEVQEQKTQIDLLIKQNQELIKRISILENK